MEIIETNENMTEFINDYYEARPQMKKPKANSFGTYDLPAWCYDIFYSLMNGTQQINKYGDNIISL